MDIQKSIVAILDRKKKIIGTGFVTGENLILTCAHVVEKVTATAVGPDTNLNLQVTVRFAVDGSETIAQVDMQNSSPSYEKDVTLLRVDALPQGVRPLLLAPAAGSAGHDFYAHGYATVAHIQGIGARGKIVTIVDNGRLVQLTSQEPDHGMSGGPVLDEQRRVVIGMITKGKGLLEKDHNLRNTQTTFATSTQVIFEVCHELKPTEICPYRSLDAFTEEDAPFFFGRERVVAKLLESLKREPRFLAILGPSGSGKSSVVRAGLIPELRRGKMPGSQKWGFITIRPADNPFKELEKAGFINPKLELEVAARDWLAKNPSKTRLVLFIDQFEEVLISTHEEIQQKFTTQLANLLNTSIEITVILTLRDDFYSRFLFNAAKLAEWLEHGLVNIPSTLEQDELSAIIIRPANSVGLDFDIGLVNNIIADAAEIDHTKGIARNTILPLLEFSLAQLWERRLEGKLTLNAYNDINKVTGSLTLWADREYYAFNDGERKAARRILTSLVNVGDVGQNIPNTKRMRDFEEICFDEFAPTVIQKLVQARLLVAEKSKIEIIHEALISQWQKFSKWIEEDREYLIIYDHFMESAKEWEKSGRDRGLLYRGSRLLKINKLLQAQNHSFGVVEKDFLEASLKGDPLLENLKRIMGELSSSLDLDHALSRTLALLNEAIRGEQSTVMLLHPEDNLLHYRSGVGVLIASDEQKPSRFTPKIGVGLAGWVVEHRQSVIVADLYQDDRWIPDIPDFHRYRSVVAAPILVGVDIIGSIMVFNSHVAFFDDGALEMLRVIGAQVAIAINNAQLYELIRDQAERLGSMLRQQQIEAARNNAILQAVSDGILFTDPNHYVTFINKSLENIFDVNYSKIVDSPFENFATLLSKSQRNWIEIMNNWSDRQGKYQPSETNIEEIVLYNGSVVLLSMAPLLWHVEFLGTVFVFHKMQ